MKPAERDKLTQETHQALLGIPGTADKGLVGDVRELKGDLKHMNGRVGDVVEQTDKNTNDIKWIKRIGGAGGTALTALIGIFKGMGG